jgi:hypothetical protein
MGALAGGLVWFRFFFEPSKDFVVFVFDFASFHILASLCGAAPGFWILEVVRRRQSQGKKI